MKEEGKEKKGREGKRKEKEGKKTKENNQERKGREAQFSSDTCCRLDRWKGRQSLQRAPHF
jgi:hypothetical protein